MESRVIKVQNDFRAAQQGTTIQTRWLSPSDQSIYKYQWLNGISTQTLGRNQFSKNGSSHNFHLVLGILLVWSIHILILRTQCSMGFFLSHIFTIHYAYLFFNKTPSWYPKLYAYKARWIIVKSCVKCKSGSIYLYIYMKFNPGWWNIMIINVNNINFIPTDSKTG